MVWFEIVLQEVSEMVMLGKLAVDAAYGEAESIQELAGKMRALGRELSQLTLDVDVLDANVDIMSWRIIVIRAKTADSLKEIVSNLTMFLERTGQKRVADDAKVCYRFIPGIGAFDIYVYGPVPESCEVEWVEETRTVRVAKIKCEEMMI